MKKAELIIKTKTEIIMHFVHSQDPYYLHSSRCADIILQG